MRPAPGTTIGRYTFYDAIGVGGMATVHLGRMRGDASFARVVAVKRLKATYVDDPVFVSMFLDETRLAARIKHPNVVPILDVVSTGAELFMVMDYAAGESLATLVSLAAARGETVPLPVCVAIVSDVLHGLHAAHEARDANGAPLGIVHRDVSPQNVLVGGDGLTRLLDFGIAKARRHAPIGAGEVKGKVRYMAPEQMSSVPLARAADLYATGVVLWELLAGRRLFADDTDQTVVDRSMVGDFALASEAARERGGRTDDELAVIERLDAVVRRAMDLNPANRFEDARAMAAAVEKCLPRAGFAEVATWVEHVAGARLDERAALVANLEIVAASDDVIARATETTVVPPPPPSPRAQTVERLEVLGMPSLPLDALAREARGAQPASAPAAASTTAVTATARSRAAPMVPPAFAPETFVEVTPPRSRVSVVLSTGVPPRVVAVVVLAAILLGGGLVALVLR